ncbi:MAG: hypothetical protein EBR82_83965 [Caulobacteraceae bacterium]|nr:hypothetical protein [Caulobacteraceae bacterium]
MLYLRLIELLLLNLMLNFAILGLLLIIWFDFHPYLLNLFRGYMMGLIVIKNFYLMIVNYHQYYFYYMLMFQKLD